MNYIISVDAGGTKTHSEAYTLEGEFLQEANSSYGSVIVNKDKALINIKTAIDECIQTLENSQCEGIVVGAAGAETGDALNYIKDYLKQYYKTKIIITNDAKLAMYGRLKGKNGILLISGTGSIAYGKKEHIIERCGGWGHLIDDRGSGYYIAMEAIRGIVNERDQKQGLSNLSKKILEHLDIQEIKYLIDYVYKSSKGEIASLVPVILKEAERNDKNAIKIFIDAGEKLYELIKTLNTSMALDRGNITFSGSIMKIDFVRRTVIDLIKKQIPELVLIENECSPAMGGYYIFMERRNELGYS
ncbi:ATPase [Vallitalea longa]|uniref:ATPase n=1 Tax=Vallitalea longa TaxID=2936439 RepID=A0A9W6DFR1_9FIRM|nr:BadF/BadG/BcrA/BcrD ATPase family protein [Vallitalea longa]GKX29732.1 ATPase [Vallitalea longa]